MRELAAADLFGGGHQHVCRSVTPNSTTFSVAVVRSEFVIKGGRRLTQDEIVGLELSVTDEAGKVTAFRIESSSIDPVDPAIRMYDISVKAEPSGAWRPLCQAGPDGITMALPVSGTWTRDGRHENTPTFTLACTAGAIGKCVRFGYKPWETNAEGVSLWAYHEACTRMMRADYCGDGRSWTQDGTPIEFYDRLHIQIDDHRPEMAFEAAWGADGAHCVSHTRIAELLTPERLAAVCGRPVPIDRCSEEAMQQDGGALLFNDSGDLKLHEGGRP